MTNRFAWAFTTCSLFGAAAFVAACSDDNNGNKLPTVVEDSGSNPTDTGSNPTDTGTNPTDGGGTCDIDREPKVRAGGTGPFCPFSVLRADSSTSYTSSYCAAGETCCSAAGNTGKTGNCQTTGCGFATTTAGTEWQCMAAEHCGAGKTCFLVSANPENPVDVGSPAGCGPTFQKAFRAGGTRCKAAAEAGDLQICGLPVSVADGGTSDAGSLPVCPAGKTCTAFTTYGRDLGYCK